MPTKYKPAPEVAQIASSLIAEYHHHLTECNVRMEYAFINEPIKVRGKEVLGTCRKVGSYSAYLASEDVADFDHDQDPFFLITISWRDWRVLNDDQKIALVDHELCHAYAYEDEDSGEIKLKILPHDLEEFNSIVRRHGLWLNDVEQFAFAMRDHLPQLRMDYKAAEAA